ncbi:hypothetical protein ASD50_17335 [Mesorhizobium sp. Root552]|nr:hypothetical protein ASD50_17335 [Mesorhizobium sp. Root552]
MLQKPLRATKRACLITIHKQVFAIVSDVQRHFVIAQIVRKILDEKRTELFKNQSSPGFAQNILRFIADLQNSKRKVAGIVAQTIDCSCQGRRQISQAERFDMAGQQSDRIVREIVRKEVRTPDRLPICSCIAVKANKANFRFGTCRRALPANLRDPRFVIVLAVVSELLSAFGTHQGRALTEVVFGLQSGTTVVMQKSNLMEVCRTARGTFLSD